MYTSDDVTNLIESFKNYNQALEKLSAFCNIVAKGLDYSECSSLSIIEDEVHFRAEWYGSYQAHDYKDFSFPAYMLSQGTESVISHLRELCIKEQEEANKAKLKKSELLERQLLAELKAKYGE